MVGEISIPAVYDTMAGTTSMSVQEAHDVMDMMLNDTPLEKVCGIRSVTHEKIYRIHSLT